MGKPRMIIVIRHAQSEGNKNRDIHQTIPDHRVKLTQEGWSQAHEAGRRLRSMLRADDTLHFYTSPYRRTRETTEGILSTLTSDDPSPSPFPRHKIKVYEEPRLREQDFGNFQPCSAEMERMWQERADYGHFFYRIPNGESAADAYDRISGFNESLWRQFGEDDFASVCVLVTHGLMSRVFLMKWYHFSVEYFEDLRNVNHCEFLIMRKKEDSGKYVLENQLRTWSDLKRERLAAFREKEKLAGVDKEKSDKDKVAQIMHPPPFRKRWGGCPNGCDHGKYPPKKGDSLRAVQHNGRASPSASPTNGGESLPFRRLPGRRWQSSDEEDIDDPRGHEPTPPALDLSKTREEVVSSPDGTPSFISVDDRLRQHLKSPANNSHLLSVKQVGRDFGGTASGNTSHAGSDTEFSAEEDTRKRLAKGKGTKISSLVGKLHSMSNGHGHGHGHSHGRGHGRSDSNSSDGDNENERSRRAPGIGHGAKADALGDQTIHTEAHDHGYEDHLVYGDHVDEVDNESEDPGFREVKEKEQSVSDSVY
ncbi:phosphoglycerate mutase [Xylogone sp. PMI_703]|nr:phosphoglycerate mutase [Xylogone sp. PMI_703]